MLIECVGHVVEVLARQKKQLGIADVEKKVEPEILLLFDFRGICRFNVEHLNLTLVQVLPACG